jgi:hypothetical protein
MESNGIGPLYAPAPAGPLGLTTGDLLGPRPVLRMPATRPCGCAGLLAAAVGSAFEKGDTMPRGTAGAWAPSCEAAWLCCEL